MLKENIFKLWKMGIYVVFQHLNKQRYNLIVIHKIKTFEQNNRYDENHFLYGKYEVD